MTRKAAHNTRLGTMAGYVVKSGAVLRWKPSGDLTDRGSKSATVPSAETLAATIGMTQHDKYLKNE
jgi:hypothetical protein